MDWASIFIHDTDWQFIAEILLRCLVMFVMIILFLRLTGKRGVRQLSIFEVAIILALGSIAGDPMFDETLPLLQAFVVMSSIIVLYRITTYLAMKYQPFEDLIEGKPIYIVKDGELVMDKISQGKMSHDEFFAEMRQQGIEHLGQIRVGLLESDGNLSILPFADDQVRYGLALFPGQQNTVKTIQQDCIYACNICGHTQQLQNVKQQCPRCDHACWSVAINTTRLL